MPAIRVSATVVVLLYRAYASRLRFVGAGFKPAPTPRPFFGTLNPGGLAQRSELCYNDNSYHYGLFNQQSVTCG